MPNWVKCTRSDGELPIFVNMDLVLTVSQEAPEAFSTLKFQAGFIHVKETPEHLLDGWRDVTK